MAPGEIPGGTPGTISGATLGGKPKGTAGSIPRKILEVFFAKTLVKIPEGISKGIFRVITCENSEKKCLRIIP